MFCQFAKYIFYGEVIIIYILTDFNYATLTFPYIFQKYC